MRKYTSFLPANIIPFNFSLKVWRRITEKLRVTKSGCWEWIGFRLDGYGKVGINNKAWMTHRVVYEALVGNIPEAQEIDHLCRNRACCNPDHLECVTSYENFIRGNSPNAINARKTHCNRGHEFTPENTIITKVGHRKCRTCERSRQKALMRRKRAEVKEGKAQTE